MTVEERKLRSRIRKKCRIYISELALAELSGVIPDKEMNKSKFRDSADAIAKIKLIIIGQSFQTT